MYEYTKVYFKPTEEEGGVRWEQWSSLEKEQEEAVRPRRDSDKTKVSWVTSCPDVKGLILIRLMMEILQVQPDYDSWALRGLQDYKPSQLPSNKQTWVTQMSASSTHNHIYTCCIALLSQILGDAVCTLTIR